MSIPAPAPSPSPIVVTNIKFEDIRSVHVHCTWSNGVGDNRIVVVSERDDITVPLDGTEWDSDAKYREVVFSVLEENNTPISWVVYKGNAENVTVYNLKPKTKYYFYFFEYDIINDETVYYQDFSTATVTTAGDEPRSNLRIIVTDSLTKLPVEDADITITNRNQHIISKARTTERGDFTTIELPTGGVWVTVTAPGYNGVSLVSVFIKNMTDNKSSYRTSTTQEYSVRLIQTTTL